MEKFYEGEFPAFGLTQYTQTNRVPNPLTKSSANQESIQNLCPTPAQDLAQDIGQTKYKSKASGSAGRLPNKYTNKKACLASLPIKYNLKLSPPAKGYLFLFTHSALHKCKHSLSVSTKFQGVGGYKPLAKPAPPPPLERVPTSFGAGGIILLMVT